MTELDRDVARAIVTHLKAGTTPMDLVPHINVGNEKWYSAADEQFDEIATDGDSLVRFINGYYGDGKTHVMGMLKSLAANKKWLVSYVTAENTPLAKFDVVYSEIVKNITLPFQMAIPEWILPSGTRGATALLGGLFAQLYLEAYRLPERSGLQKERVLEVLRHRAAEVASMPAVHYTVGLVVRAYVEAMIRSDQSSIRLLSSWLEGQDVTVAGIGVKRRIDQKYAREAARSISVLARRAGATGILVLLDEAERIMEQSRAVRNKSYGVLRDLLDNADSQGGMQASIIYVAATPEMFRSEKGFAEYDALRSRLGGAMRFTPPGLVDWRGVVLDLTKTPMPHDMLVQLAQKIVGIHAVARDWDPGTCGGSDFVEHVVGAVDTGGFGVSKPRLLASLLATLLDLLEQNREADLASILTPTLQSVRQSLSASPDPKAWG